MTDFKHGVWYPLTDCPKDGTIFNVKGGIAHFYDGKVYSLTGLEYPGRPIQWPCKEWTPLPNPPEDL